MILNQTGIAAPITGPDGVAVPSHHWDSARIEHELLPYIVDAANAIAPQAQRNRL
ncbi:MAG: hypothetical protein IME92_00785 [Proteobacteria bacterium]|nr:hypothetical protein [Pseudomonadota bacterium]